MASLVLSTLHHVTGRKLAKLAQQIDNFASVKASILADVDSKPTQVEKVKALLDGCTKHGIPMDRAGLSIDNIKSYLAQAEHDPSVSAALLDDWMAKLIQQIGIQQLKYEFARLFGKLVTERIRNPNDQMSQAPPKQLAAGKKTEDYEITDLDLEASFEHVGRKEMYDQRQIWESYAFNKLDRDQKQIDGYLKELFSFSQQTNRLNVLPLKQLQIEMGNFETEHFTEDDVRWCIAGVLKSDLFAGDKREALLDLQNRPAVLKEMADVLNLDLDAIESWTWGSEPICLTMRRHLNGKYRVSYDEELHTAVFLHYIGAKLAVHVKEAFTTFFNSSAWSQTSDCCITPDARQRRQYFLGESLSSKSKHNVNASRRERYQKSFFMTKLPGELETVVDYDDVEVDTGNDSTSESPLEIKEAMHRLMTAEMLLQKYIYGEFTVIQSDFRWFGPGLPHDTIFATLKFLGFKGRWLSFFRRYLEAPVVWSYPVDATSSQSSVRIRSRGTPMYHILSDALGEAVLFCLDFAVNKRTGGLPLYRFFDDLWFWGQQPACIKAWNAMKEFSSIMGLELNIEKTGCVQVFGDPRTALTGPRKLPEELPSGGITWGFLKLDAVEARWVVDETIIEEHTTELKRQLGACRSVLAWVQAWNSYMYRFLASNMARPALCFGQEHVHMVIRVFVRIQKSLFGDDGKGDVGQYLRDVIRERFGSEAEIPDGFIYFPTELGGLELRNPLVPLFLVQDSFARQPADWIKKAFEGDEENYEKLKKRFDRGEYIPTSLYPREWKPVSNALVPERRGEVDESSSSPDEAENRIKFMSWAEYTHFSEETSQSLQEAYDLLQQIPRRTSIERTDAVKVAFKALRASTKRDKASKKGNPITEDWNKLDPYWRWIFGLYAGDVVAKFGGLEIGEKGMLPLGLVEALTSERTRWQG